MRITESQLRRIIADEAKKFKRGKRVNESFAGANEELFNAMENFIQGWMDESGIEDPAEACEALRNEVEGFCQSFEENY
jgi:hypothetical protein